MDELMTLATTAATILASGTVGAIADESGRSVVNAARKLRDIVRLRFRGDPGAVSALEQVTSGPVDDGAIALLASHINRFASTDPDFHARLSALNLSSIVSEQPSFQTSISDRATVGKIVNIGKANTVEF